MNNRDILADKLDFTYKKEENSSEVRGFIALCIRYWYLFVICIFLGVLGAFIYNSLGIPIASGILRPLTGTLLNPVVAGAAMALSSITVVSNANRLLRFKPKE